MNLSTHGPLVLLVEQDIEICDMLETLLTLNGYEVMVAHTGHEAIEAVSRQVPQAIVSSLVFQDMDGTRLCARIRQLPHMADALMIALTGYADAALPKIAADAGFDHYFVKPVNLLVILELLALHCGSAEEIST